MSINPLQHIDEIDRGIDALHATRGAQTLDDATPSLVSNSVFLSIQP
jgi:hypothetical protein